MPKQLFQKGRKKTGGKVKGTPNKKTKTLREAYTMLAENNQEKFQQWIDKIAVKNPAMAMKLMLDLSEYVLPKLNRTEIVNEQEQESTIIIIGGQEIKI